ncbi:MAG: GNAT family N-acetyltransferase [Acidimicrobiales bacterium]
MTLTARVRQAGVADAAAIAVVHVKSWKHAYPGLLPQQYLDRLRAEDRRPGWEHALSSFPWPVVLAAENDGRLVAFASLGPTRDVDIVDAEPGDAPASAATGEVHAFYLDPDVWGTGVADELMVHSLEVLRGGGFSKATLWVLGTNVRARRFYERHGWRPDGTTKEHDWVDFVALDTRYELDLTD